jgi:hypothetical protein
METKCCTRCDEVKLVNEFNKGKNYCKFCQKTIDSNYRNSKNGQNKIKNWKKGKQGIYGWFDSNLTLYIGQSTWLNSRISTHKSYYNNPSWAPKSMAHLYPLLNQHPNASIRIIEECSPELLLKREQYYIDTYKPLYNKLV